MKKLILILAILLFPFSTKAMTLNIVSDIHAGNSTSCTSYRCVPKWKESFQNFLNETNGTIVTVGDNTDKASKTYAQELRNMTSNREIYWANGNHDKKVYVGGSKHYIIDKDDWRIVIIDHKSCGSKDINWLKSNLKNYKDKKVVAFLHYPVFKQGSTKISKDCKKIKKLFEEYKIDYVFSGHWHGDHWMRESNGVTYKAIQGLTNGYSVNYQTIEFK